MFCGIFGTYPAPPLAAISPDPRQLDQISNDPEKGKRKPPDPRPDGFKIFISSA
jgi:hypothetical protein